jgi:hypothetical protein
VHVNAASAGQPGLNAAPALLPLPPSAAPLPRAIEDKIAGLLPAISAPAIHTALHLADDPALTDAFIGKAADALAHHDTQGALHILTELVHRQPDAGIRILNDPALSSIHNSARELLGRVTLEAKIGAQNTLAAAAHLVATRVSPPESAATLALADRFFETGQYINYIRANELGLLVISWSPETAVKSHAPRDLRIARAVERLASLWRKAPVLILLFAWLLLGAVVIPLDPDLWGIGFLAIVALQFCLTIRNWPGRR